MIVEGSNFPPPASAESLASLRQVLPRETPPDYFAFLQKADGGQICFDADDSSDFDCIRIYSVSRMLELRPSLETLLPSLVVIGGDQGSQYLGYDRSASAPWPIVMFLPGSGAAQVAPTFTELAHRYFRKIGERVEVCAMRTIVLGPDWQSRLWWHDFEGCGLADASTLPLSDELRRNLDDYYAWWSELYLPRDEEDEYIPVSSLNWHLLDERGFELWQRLRLELGGKYHVHFRSHEFKETFADPQQFKITLDGNA